MKVWNDEVNSCASSCKYSCIRNINGTEEALCSHRNEILNIRMLDGELIDDDCLFKKQVIINDLIDLGFEQASELNTIHFYNDKCFLSMYDNKVSITQEGDYLVNKFPIDNLEDLKYLLNKYNLI